MSIEEKLTQIANNVPLVYDAGYDEGYAEGIAQGGGGDTEQAFEDGKIQQNKEFWRNFVTRYVSNGETAEKTDYAYAFRRWLPQMFYPTENMNPTSAVQMFAVFNEYGTDLLDLSTRLSECGVEINFENATSVLNCFQYAYISRVPELKFINCNDLTSVFSYSKIETIDKLILKDDGTQTFTKTFIGATELKHITIEGKIGNSIEFAQSSKLTTESVQSIIDALMTITDGVARTLTLHADVRAKLTSEQVNTIKNVKGWSLIPE